MWRFVCIFLVVLSCFQASAATLRVVTWNCRWFPGGSPGASVAEQKAQMKAAQLIVEKLNPDILFLQEVRDWNAAEQLCSVVPGLTVATVSNFRGYPQNLVIASKLPADSAWFSSWNPTIGKGDPPRGYAFAALKLPDEQVLLTYSVHLKANVGDIQRNIPSREEASKQLITHIRAMLKLYGKRFNGCGIVVGGDFNTSLDNPAFKEERSLRWLKSVGLKSVFGSLPPAERVTIPSEGRYADDTFDYIFTTGLTTDSVGILHANGTSDHNPVLAVLSY